jgi:hypothetical protein
VTSRGKLGAMMISRRPFGVLASLTVAASFLAPAHAIELNGVWASDPALCDKVFTKNGKKVTFAPLSDLYGSGFIIEGNRLRGKVARCTIKSRKEDGDTVLLAATCSTTIAAQDLEFTLKTVDANTISRVYPGTTAMQVNFHRCPP